LSFHPSEDQIAIARMARDFADREIAPHALAWDAAREFPVATLRRAAELGMAGLYVGADVGGAALTRLDGVMVFEALATGCPCIAAYLSIHNMVGWIIDHYGSSAQRHAFLPRLNGMGLLASYCLTEAASGSDAAALVTQARLDGDVYVLNGTKQFTSGAGAADLYLVMARSSGPGPGGISAFIVEKGTPGLTFGTDEKKMGWNAQPTRAVHFDDCRIPLANRVGQEGEGFKIAMAGLDGGRLNIAACSLGGARSALDKAMAFLEARRAFGKSLTQFQALQFKLADMATELEAARALLFQAAAALDAKAADATRLCAMAKRFVTDAGFAIANEALQLHGGYGYLNAYGVEKIVRDLRVHQILEGTNEIMRVIIARSLIGKNA
jgi:alkylation response protein AidB-like acyl-CoA dehydrogenase